MSHIKDGYKLFVGETVLSLTAALASVTAMILNFVVKDIKDETLYHVTLDVTIAEFVLVLTAVMLILLKHIIRWCNLRRLEDQFIEDAQFGVAVENEVQEDDLHYN